MTAWTYHDLAGELIARDIPPHLIDGKAIDFAAPTVEAAAAGVELSPCYRETGDDTWWDEEWGEDDF